MKIFMVVLPTEQDIFYGDVTIGNLWQFGKLDKVEKTIYQDLNLFKIPDDLLDLGKVLYSRF
ncbi:hypothetical protein [Dolichospermum circinale]|uniref:hypothetical protein n=2 Tax=Dolichospermum circinale TaxID=109265 RepID=UPI0023315935|nr:hypothetical protein [Dolichospermum circinale]MDB9461516.1 hypothetical protein [Dolichospermum circinale CS-541/04]MDB9547461.1 hypothetical protein [Dolichospermum circinale CS-1031]